MPLKSFFKIFETSDEVDEYLNGFDERARLAVPIPVDDFPVLMEIKVECTVFPKHEMSEIANTIAEYCERIKAKSGEDEVPDGK